MQRYSNYMYVHFQPETRKKMIDRAVRILRKLRETTPFKSIAFTGVSGALIASIVADRLKCGMIIVRKSAGCSHSYYGVEGDIDDYIILDDFAESGETIMRIKNSIYDRHPSLKCYGVYFYNSSCPKDINEFRTGIPCLNPPFKIPKIN